MSNHETDPDRMTTWQFLRWFTAPMSRTQLAAVAVTEALCVIFAAAVPWTFPLPAWAKIAAGAAFVVLSQALAWLTLGSQRVQKWIIGA
jgi:hypothetical protein